MGMVRHDGAGLEAFGGEAWPWKGGDLQTLKTALLPKIQPLPDGREIVVDLDDGDKLLAEIHVPSHPLKGAMILVHGLGGSMDSALVRFLASQALAKNIAVMRVNMRGAGKARNLARKTYNAKLGTDLIPFIAAMRQAIGDRVAMIMVGHSLGGAVMLNMIVDHPHQLEGLDGAVSISAPIDMHAACQQLHRPRNWLYMRYLLKELKHQAARIPDIDPALLSEVNEATTLIDFDDVMTAPLGGFVSAEDYYTAATTAYQLKSPAIPTLLIHADNDPWIPPKSYLDLPKTRNLDVMVSHGGGHGGFYDSKGVWSNRLIFDWLNRLTPPLRCLS